MSQHSQESAYSGGPDAASHAAVMDHHPTGKLPGHPDLNAASVTIRWDYSVVSVHARHNDTLEHALQAKGDQGWELVFVNVPLPNEFHCIFRKPGS